MKQLKNELNKEHSRIEKLLYHCRKYDMVEKHNEWVHKLTMLQKIKSLITNIEMNDVEVD